MIANRVTIDKNGIPTDSKNNDFTNHYELTFRPYAMQPLDLLQMTLAFQNGLASKEEIKAIVITLNSKKNRDVREAFSQLNIVSESELEHLIAISDRHLEKFSGDVMASLAGIEGVSSLREELISLEGLNLETQSTILCLQSLAQDKDAVSVFATEPCNTIGVGPVERSQSLKRFRIINEHARGGLGVIFLARDEELGRDVALKQIRADRIDHQVLRDKFVREAQITGQLEHPGIVPIYAMGSGVTGRPYYAMRFIKGEDLQSKIKSFYQDIKVGTVVFDGPELRNLLRRFIDVCNAIDYAHNRGILHRDLKPGNVMLGKFGETLVVDWGLAKQQGRTNAESQAESMSTPGIAMQGSGKSEADSETLYGSFVGSPAYAPPEQMLGKLDKIGPWSDVYSLGAMLYQLLTGSPPVKGRSLREIIAEVTEGIVQRPEHINPSVPRLLGTICMKAMAKLPEDRFASVADLRQEIENWLNDLPTNLYRESVVTRLARWGRHHPAVTAAVAASMLFLLAGLSLFACERSVKCILRWALGWRVLFPPTWEPIHGQFETVGREGRVLAIGTC